ncbi:MAG: transcriptional regulator [Candidatus Nitrosocosmicus sp.]
MPKLIIENLPIHKHALAKAILQFESISKFAKSIGTTRQAVHGWLYNCKMGVPPKYCKKVEEVTMGQITRNQLRPDVYGNLSIKEHSNKEKLSVCISILKEISSNLDKKIRRK